MAVITINFDCLISVVGVHYTRDVGESDRKKIFSPGGFTFKSPDPIEAEQVPVEPEQVPIPTAQTVIDGLTQIEQKIDDYNSIIDKRCKDITVEYSTTDPDDEYIRESCRNIFNRTDGIITYDMYIKALEFQMKLDNFLARRNAESGKQL